MEPNPHILVVDDDREIRDLLGKFLEKHTLRVTTARDGREARRAWLNGHFQLVVLDLMLPGESGLDLARWLRSQSNVPIVMLTAMGEETDRIIGLELGADDYVVKPFSVRELLARIDAVLRRSPERAMPVSQLEFSNGTADFARRELRYHDGGRSELSQREAELLAYLSANPGRAISREEILTRVWRLDPKGLSTRAIDMQVVRLREKLRDDGDVPAVLLTVRGTGYMLAARGAATATDRAGTSRNQAQP